MYISSVPTPTVAYFAAYFAACATFICQRAIRPRTTLVHLRMQGLVDSDCAGTDLAELH